MATTTKTRKRGIRPAARTMAEAIGGPADSIISRTFDLMGIAEEEIAAAKHRHPKAQTAFKFLCPSPEMSAFDEKVYRAHARELIDRHVRGLDMRPGTRAEAMLSLSEGSLRHPLEAAHQALFEKLFAEVMGFAVDGGVPSREPFPGACDDVLRGLVRRLARDRS